MKKDSAKRFAKVLPRLLPAEAQSILAYLHSRDIVSTVAEEREGFEPDDGFRPMTAIERIREFDGLSIEQKNDIIDKMGMQWYLSYADEIRRIKDALPEFGGINSGNSV